MKTYIRIFFILITLVSTVSTTIAAWGDADTTFGSLGMALDGIANHYPRGVAVQADGKILVTGYRVSGGRQRFFLRRYLSNGQVDTSFGSNGSAVSNALINVNADYRGARIVVQANGRIAVYGTQNDRPVIWRFTSSGSGDSSIGTGGMRVISAYQAAPETVESIATYSNILYVGVRTTSSPSTTVILKYNSSGTQDTSFGTGGEAVTDASQHFTLSVDATTGNILIGARRNNDVDFGIERFLPTGQIDPTFNHWDAVYSDYGGNPLASPHMFIRLASGQYAFNYRWISGTGPFIFSARIVHFSTSGAVTGSTVYEDDPPFSYVTGNCPDILAQQANGRILAKSVDNDYIYRFSTSYFTINKMGCESYSTLQSPTRAVLQSDDKMIAAGRYDGDIAIVRTLP